MVNSFISDYLKAANLSIYWFLCCCFFLFFVLGGYREGIRIILWSWSFFLETCIAASHRDKHQQWLFIFITRWSSFRFTSCWGNFSQGNTIVVLISCKTFLWHFLKDHRKCWGEIMCRASGALGELSPNDEHSLFFISAIITACLKVTGFNQSNEGWKCDCLQFYVIVWNVNVSSDETVVTNLCVLSICLELLLHSAHFLFWRKEMSIPIIHWLNVSFLGEFSVDFHIESNGYLSIC